MLEQINQIAQHNPEYAMIIAFLLATVESLPFVGSLFPGMLTMPVIGYLMASNKIPPWTTFMVIIIGAMIGDFIGYYLGIYCKRIAHQKAVQYQKTHWLEAGEAFVRKYGPLSIIVGRFFGPFRSSIPLFAGIFDMKLTHFTIAAIPSVTLWAVIHLAPGVALVWFDFDVLSHSQDLLNYLLMISALVITVSSMRPKQSLKLHPKLTSFFRSMCSALNLRGASSCEKLYQISQILLACVIMAVIIMRGGFNGLNQSIYQLMSAQNSTLIKLSLIHDAICYIPFILLLTCIMAYHLIRNDQPEKGAELFISVSSAFTICFILKYLILYPRPEHIAAFLGNQSLPSGHSCLTTAFLFAIQPRNDNAKHVQYYCHIFIAVTMLTRIIVGAHWLSDVLFGWMIGYLGYAIGQMITNLIEAPLLKQLCQKASIVSAGQTGSLSVSKTQILSLYCIIAILFAAITNKLSIAPYLL